MQNDEFISRVDVPAMLGQFLNALRDDDILTELFQNDLDQRATRTIVSFERDRLVVEGNGAPVEDAGWTRLTYVAGAGGDVEAKRLGFGIKNHGLRACFMLGDEIHVRSGGKRMLLTAAVPGSGRFFDPGSWPRPRLDPEAPAHGCRIEVPYRRQPLRARGGDLVSLEPPTPERLNAMFLAAVEQLPLRFMGVVRPEVIPTWTVELRHWALGSFEVRFEVVRRSSALPRNVFRRRATSTRSGEAAVTVEEEVWTFEVATPPGDTRVASFFRVRSRIRCDVAWELDHRGSPRPVAGRLRYPIGYTSNARTAFSGIGVHYAAPFVSDGPRHGIAEGQKVLNGGFVAQCEEQVVRALRSYLIKRHGPISLNLLAPMAAGASESAVLVGAAVRGGAVAIEPVGVSSKNGKGKARTWKLLDPGARVLLPVKRGSGDWSARICSLAPAEYPCVHAHTPQTVLRLLVAAASAAPTPPWLVFDEYDVLTRMSVLKSRFPWRSDVERNAFSWQPARCRVALDVLEDSAAEVKQYAKTNVEKLLLPDSTGTVRPWSSLRRARTAPPEVPGLTLPPFIHPDLAGHPILGKGALHLKQFDLDEHLLQVDAQKWTPDTRASFFSWLVGHRGELSSPVRARLAAQEIWPSTLGGFVKFADFCRPSDPTVARLFKFVLTAPSPELSRSGWVRHAERRGVSLRTVPTDGEVSSWFDARLAELPGLQVFASAEEARRFTRLEEDLEALHGTACGPQVTKLLSKLRVLDLVGVVRAVGDVHVPSDLVRTCALRPEDCAASTHRALLERAGARVRPSREALVRALAGDGGRDSALWDRLECWRESLPSQDPGNELLNVPIFHVEDRRLTPAQVYVPGRDQGWWGTWRVALPSDLTPSRKTSARRAGAVGGEPTSEWSRQFFGFVAAGGSDRLDENIRAVIRQWGHADGPQAWWAAEPKAPCLPVIQHDARLALVPRREAVGVQSTVFLSDTGDMEFEREIAKRDPVVKFALTEVGGVRVFLAQRLRSAGVRSLREALGAPVGVIPEQPGVIAERYAAVLRSVRSPAQLNEIRAALDHAEVDTSRLRERWRAALQAIKEVRLCQGLRQEWRFRRQKYARPVPSAVDPEGTLWLAQGAEDLDGAFFAALAREMFGPTSPPLFGFALRAAVLTAHRAVVSGRRAAASAQAHLPFFDDGEDPPPPGGKEDGAAHGELKVNPSLNQPNPSPLPAGGAPVNSGRSGRRGGKGGGKPSPSANRPIDELELLHIETLKKDHYAWHCQSCLGSHEPATLAPVNSYVAAAELRRPLMQAHHVQHFRVGGARHGANLLVLCELHHRNIGDRLTRKLIVDALRSSPPAVARQFAPDPGIKPLEGVVIHLRLDGHPSPVPLYFTVEHATAWRDFPEAP